MKCYRCRNCGFIFRRPKIKIYEIQIHPDTMPMKTGVPVCPRCGSDALDIIDCGD